MADLRFQWDPKKAKSNLAKHQVGFEEASSAFSDELALVIGDPDHSQDEDRFILLGMSGETRILVVCHCFREGGDIIRIISARKAGRKERTFYLER